MLPMIMKCKGLPAMPRHRFSSQRMMSVAEGKALEGGCSWSVGEGHPHANPN